MTLNRLQRLLYAWFWPMSVLGMAGSAMIAGTDDMAIKFWGFVALLIAFAPLLLVLFIMEFKYP